MAAIAHPLPHRPVPIRSRPFPCVAPARRRPDAAVFRRRRAAVAFVAVVLLGVAVLLGGLGEAPLAAPEPAPAVQVVPVARTSYVVQPGDTLWAIARALQPEGDVRPLVQRLASARDGAPLRAGERLVLPSG